MIMAIVKILKLFSLLPYWMLVVGDQNLKTWVCGWVGGGGVDSHPSVYSFGLWSSNTYRKC